MRRPFLLLLLAPVAAATAGCPRPSLDELLGPPPADCATRPPASIEVGTGADGALTPTDGGLLIERGIQGGNHIWITVKTNNLGPTVIVDPAVHDAVTGDLLSQSNLAEVLELDTLAVDPGEPDGGWPPVTVRGILAGDPGDVIGKTVTLSATVHDACPHQATGQATGVVTGFDPATN